MKAMKATKAMKAMKATKAMKAMKYGNFVSLGTTPNTGVDCETAAAPSHRGGVALWQRAIIALFQVSEIL